MDTKENIMTDNSGFDLRLGVCGPGTTRLGFREDPSSHGDLRRPRKQATVNKIQIKTSELFESLQKELLDGISSRAFETGMHQVGTKKKQVSERSERIFKERFLPKSLALRRPTSEPNVRSGEDLSCLRITSVAFRATSAFRQRQENNTMKYVTPVEIVLRKRSKPQKFTYENYRETLESFKKSREGAKQIEARRVKTEQLHKLMHEGSTINKYNQLSDKKLRKEKSATSSMLNSYHVSMATLPQIKIS